MSFTTRDLTGVCVLVLGGSSGIGEAAAAQFAALGAEVTVTGRDVERLAAAAERLGGKVLTARVDATDPADLAAFFASDAVYDHLVVTLSGALGAGPITELTVDTLRAAFEAKVFAHVAALKAALPHLAADGSVTLVSAASARAALPGTAGLAAVNGAVEAMVRPLATELAPIRVNCVSPGVIDTPWWSALPDDAREALFTEHGSALPVGRVGTPDEAASAIVLAALNGFMTGTVLEVTGGAHLATGR